MAFINTGILLEFAIRIGFDDVVNTPGLLEQLFITSDCTNEGAVMGDDGHRDKLPMDYFQQRLAEIPRRQAETGMLSIWRNSFPTVTEIRQYLAEANIKIIHGFPMTMADFPCISIRMDNDSADDYVGGTAGEGEYVGQRIKQYVTEFDCTNTVTLATNSESHTTILYTIIKYAFMRYRLELEAYGLKNFTQAWGDVEPRSEYIEAGNFVYQRDCAVNCSKTEGFWIPQNGYTEVEGGAIDIGGGEQVPI
jgi:hypothetical protein